MALVKTDDMVRRSYRLQFKVEFYGILHGASYYELLAIKYPILFSQVIHTA